MIQMLAPYPRLQTLMILPNPILGDSSAVVQGTTYHKLMGNQRYTYTQKLIVTEFTVSLSWVNISKLKAVEVIEFFRAYHWADIKIITHTDEQYVAKLLTPEINVSMDRRAETSDPAYTARGEFGSLSLEFQGRKLV